MPYPYSSQSHTTADAVTTSFSYSDVPLLADVPHKDQLRVYENGQLRTFNVTGADNYTLNTTSELVIFNTARASGVTIKIARETDIENKEVTFTNSSVLTAQDLNKNSDQLLFLAQELFDKAQGLSLVTSGNLADDSITENQLNKNSGAEAVTTSTIRDSAVTSDKINALAITEDKIAANAVVEAKIANSAVTEDKINALAVTTGKIDDLAVTTGKIDDLAVTTGKIADNAITTAKLVSTIPILQQGGSSPYPIGAILNWQQTGVGSFTIAANNGKWFYFGFEWTTVGVDGAAKFTLLASTFHDTATGALSLSTSSSESARYFFIKIA